MARSAAVDYFQVYPFWLMDVAPIEALSMPIFTPLLGFSSITAPEMSLDVEEIDEANALFKKKVVRRGTTNSIVLQRASSWYESDFYKWILATVEGDTGGAMPLGGVTPRRTLLLVQYMARSPIPSEAANLGLGAAATAGIAISVGGANSGSFVGAAANLGAQAAVGAAMVAFGPAEFAPRIPGKAWTLHGCLPTRYKVGGDFDALSSAISIAELEVTCEYFDELALFA